MEFTVPFDTAPFVKLSIMKVVETFVEAMVLVFLVMLLFLHKIRCTLIPAIVAPVALLGTFTVMLLSGYSINILTMFGMVLAIGIIVDDAIVVVENVERLMEEKGLSRRKLRGKLCMKSRRQSLVLPWCLRRYLSRWRLPEGLSELFIGSSVSLWQCLFYCPPFWP
jgi:Cu/Ag efflux pump CusA